MNQKKIGNILTSFASAVLGIATLAIFYFVLISFIPNSWQSASIVAVVMLITILNGATHHHLEHIIDNVFFQGTKRDEESLKRLNSQLLTASSLQDVIHVYESVIIDRLELQDIFCSTLQRNEAGELSIKSIISLSEEEQRGFPPIEGHPRVFEYLKKRSSAVSISELASEVAIEESLLQSGQHKRNLGALTEREFISNHAAKVELDTLMSQIHADICVPFVVRDNLFALAFITVNERLRRKNLSDAVAFVDAATSDVLTSMQRANYFEGDLQKTEFISIASHELRTPLTAIRGYLSMILQERLAGNELSSDGRKRLEQAYSLCEQLIEMVNDILTLSRLESGKTVLEPEQISIHELTREVVKQVKNQSSTQVKIVIKKHAKPPYVWADEDGLKTVLENIVFNAVRYNREGGRVTISFHAHPYRQMVEIQVKDTGIGMTKEQMAHLFEKFYRVTSRQTEGISGTGLGLTITNEYLTRMHGGINVQSHPKKGTTFSIEVPLFTPERIEETRSNLSVVQETNQPVGLLILSKKRSHDDFSASDFNLIEIVSHQAITAIQRAKLYEGDQAKTQFVSMASHELLTPISAIEGFLRAVLSQEKKLEEKTRYFLTNVENSANRLSSLVKDLLSVSRLESGRITINSQPTDLAKLCQNALTELQFVAQDRNITLTLDPIPHNLPLALVDQEKMNQVLVNLVGNSIKYNQPDGRVSLRIETSKKQDIIRVHVTDTGIGMSKDQMAHLFEKFYRVASQQTVGIIGTGLGLYITRSIVEKMGGRISVSSKEGVGSIFTVSLPVAQNVVS